MLKSNAYLTLNNTHHNFVCFTGPVLSITGAIGGCCLAYIGPGLAYLGVHGESFLQWITGSLESRNSSKTTSTDTTELPLEGDATANIQSTSQTTDDLLLNSSKPWWWYPTFMPIWAAIARYGSQGMNDRLTEFDSQHGPVSPTTEEEESTETELVDACKRDYIFSMFFILFGIIAMVAGVLSNMYVQVNSIFYTPT
jgi:sodium-coupled neutral amino acid transporter 11